MSDYKVYFGNLRYSAFIPAPKSGMSAQRVGRVDEIETANGGSFVSSSPATHRTYDMDWPASNKDDLMPLYNLRDGVYGNGLLYLVDPFNNNAMPTHWAEPALSADTWPSLISDKNKPTTVYSGSTRTNLSLNPYPTAVGSGWISNDGALYAVAQDTSIVRRPGTASRRVDRTATTPSAIIGSLYSIGSSAWTNAARATTVPGTSYTFSIWGTANTAFSLTQIIVWFNAAGTQIGSAVTGSIQTGGVAGQWMRDVDVAVAPALAVSVGLQVVITRASGTTTASDKAWVQDAMVETTATAGPFFDGTTQYLDGRVAGWTGAANSSTSTVLAPIANMPSRSAVYTLNTPSAVAYPERSATLLVPNGQTLWVGFSGSATGTAGVFYKAVYVDGSIGPVTPVTLLSASGTTRLNMSFDGNLYNAIIFYIDTTASGSSTLTLNSSQAIYSPTGTTPTLTGTHVRGEGHTGMRFSSGITEVYIGVQGTMDTKLISAAVSLTEVGAWL